MPTQRQHLSELYAGHVEAERAASLTPQQRIEAALAAIATAEEALRASCAVDSAWLSPSMDRRLCEATGRLDDAAIQLSRILSDLYAIEQAAIADRVPA
jgi:hypothetical protein